MLKKIKAIGSIQKSENGTAKLVFLNAEMFLEQLKDMKGNLEITIEAIEEDATVLQRKKMYVLIQAFVNVARQNGDNISEREAEIFLLEKIAKSNRTTVEALNKSEVSDAISAIEKYLTDAL